MDGASTAVPAVRILLVGDSGVGKTTLLRRLCPETASKAPGWTVGANLGTLLMSPESTGAGDGLFVDILDVGGHDRFRLSRSVYYHNAHGVMLVYDATNRKSYDNLRRWMAELLAARQFGRSVVDPSVGRQARAVAERSEVADPNVPFLVQSRDGHARAPAESGPSGAAATLRDLPILVVGTKADQLGQGASRLHGPSRPFRAVEPVDAFEHVLTQAAARRSGEGLPAWFVGFMGRVARARFATGTAGAGAGTSPWPSSSPASHPAQGPFRMPVADVPHTACGSGGDSGGAQRARSTPQSRGWGAWALSWLGRSEGGHAHSDSDLHEALQSDSRTPRTASARPAYGRGPVLRGGTSRLAPLVDEEEHWIGDNDDGGASMA